MGQDEERNNSIFLMFWRFKSDGNWQQIAPKLNAQILIKVGLGRHTLQQVLNLPWAKAFFKFHKTKISEDLGSDMQKILYISRMGYPFEASSRVLSWFASLPKRALIVVKIFNVIAHVEFVWYSGFCEAVTSTFFYS